RLEGAAGAKQVIKRHAAEALLLPFPGGEVDVDTPDDFSRLITEKDEGGTVHSCSAVCTHMGCLVHWNSAERSRDCPCHGSRFDHDGKVIQGPANEDLEPGEL
ncbi:MAG TPA: Rieske 2Fe-2S domain-containing protein, partial [Pyrinomonadaceae bacterium]|nr:Rieske 2Fe-2S domain-containing protein [Pyrinomonadaceae bacterium]